MPVCSAPNTCEGDALSCRPLFGRPAANTGLGEGECGPVCACEGEAWSVPDYDQAFVDALRAWTPVEPASPSEDDPYSREPRPAPRPELFCGFIVEDRAAQTYRLETFDSLGALEQAGARLTHTGACGTCSTLRDLAVYIGTPDLTTPVRECGLRGLSESQDAARACLEEIGFSSACADTWGYNAAHTAVVCLSDCSPSSTRPSTRRTARRTVHPVRRGPERPGVQGRRGAHASELGVADRALPALRYRRRDLARAALTRVSRRGCVGRGG